MDQGIATSGRRGETAAHANLKRLAVLWAQAHGYSACAVEVKLPRCRYRADVAAYRPQPKGIGCTAIFECKQARPDLRKDNYLSVVSRARLETVYRRRQILEKNLRIHYPTLRGGDSLFPEWESHDFDAINHRGYARVTRELLALQNRLHDGTKFETLVRYRCANLFFLVLPSELLREPEAPVNWGLLVERDGSLSLARKPLWHESTPAEQECFLLRIALGGTRQLNKQLGICFEDVLKARHDAI
jgi:hypothetical protein